MDGVYAEQERDAEAGFAREHLQLVGFLTGENVQERADFPVPYLVREARIAEVLVGCVDILIW